MAQFQRAIREISVHLSEYQLGKIGRILARGISLPYLTGLKTVTTASMLNWLFRLRVFLHIGHEYLVVRLREFLHVGISK